MAIINSKSCESIQCGATTQLEAGMQEIMDCSAAGYSGVRSCLDPICIGDLMPAMCRQQPIPYSPPNNVNHPIDEMFAPPEAMLPPLGRETKHRRSYYQELVDCPGNEISPFEIGLSRWGSSLFDIDTNQVLNTIPVINDLGFMELAGFLLPAIGIGLVGYLYINGKFTK